ncbi:flavin reductase family protein [Rhizobium sp. TH2]|nr:flavin reductase family protein [Rhizobium sp. TH2]
MTAPAPDAADYRLAMRHFAGNVSVITVGSGDRRSGLVATSTVSLSVDPPLMLVCVNRTSSSWPLFATFGHFGVNSLGPQHQPIAERFTGQGGVKGTDRFALGRWRSSPTGAPLLIGASVALDCEIEDMIEKSTHAILIGRVRSIEIGEEKGALIYWQGGYRPIDTASP